jgi:hypothetical protein
MLGASIPAAAGHANSVWAGFRIVRERAFQRRPTPSLARSALSRHLRALGSDRSDGDRKRRGFSSSRPRVKTTRLGMKEVSFVELLIIVLVLLFLFGGLRFSRR